MKVYPNVWSQIRNEYQLFTPAHAIAINPFVCKFAGTDVCTNSKEHTCLGLGEIGPEDPNFKIKTCILGFWREIKF